MKTLVILFCLMSLGCQSPKYIEKNSIPLSQAIYGAKDSAEVSRYDLSTKYIDEAAKLVPPPPEDKRIKISPIYEN